MNIDRTRLIMAQIPGASADDFERDILGWVRPDAAPAPDTLRRLPVIAAKAPLVLARQTKAIAALHADQTAWWRSHVLGGATGDPWGAARRRRRPVRARHAASSPVSSACRA